MLPQFILTALTLILSTLVLGTPSPMPDEPRSSLDDSSDDHAREGFGEDPEVFTPSLYKQPKQSYEILSLTKKHPETQAHEKRVAQGLKDYAIEITASFASRKGINVDEIGIPPLERLSRIATTFATNSQTNDHWLVIREWLSWWDGKSLPVVYDMRTVPEKFMMYVARRESGEIKATPDIVRIERNLNLLYRLTELFIRATIFDSSPPQNH